MSFFGEIGAVGIIVDKVLQVYVRHVDELARANDIAEAALAPTPFVGSDRRLLLPTTRTLNVEGRDNPPVPRRSRRTP